MSPQRIQRRRTAGWRMPADAIYIGRPSRWGNPWRIYHGHTLIGPPWSVARETWRLLPASECQAGYITSSPGLGPAAAVKAFEDLLRVRRRDEPDRLREWLAPLTGRDLACWCPEGSPCHGDVLLTFANPTDQRPPHLPGEAVTCPRCHRRIGLTRHSRLARHQARGFAGWCPASNALLTE